MQHKNSLGGEIENLRILIAEDNKTNQLVISKILEYAGHTPRVVSNGQEALDVLVNECFDLMVLDMQMPVMGGIETAKIYKSMNVKEGALPIIILTANTTTDAIRECKEAGIDAYLTKPINAKKLITTILPQCSYRLILAQHNQRTMGGSTKIVTSNNEDGIIDYDVVNSIISLSSNNDFIGTIMNSFYSDTNRLLTDMEKSLSSNNHESFLEYAHALKGSAGSIGAQKVHDYCKTLLLPETDSSNYIPILKKLIASFEDTKIRLDNYTASKQLVPAKQEEKTIN